MFTKTIATTKLLKLNNRIRGISGGTSASKTISIILLLIDYAQSVKQDCVLSIVSESMPHLRRGAMRDFLTIMKTHRYYQDMRWNKSEFTYDFSRDKHHIILEFFSVDQASKVRGARRDVLFINEANNVPYEAYSELEIRTKDIIWLDWNPTSEFWFYTDVLPHQLCDFITLTYKDNEALDKKVVDAIEARKYNSNWWKVYGLGELGDIEGRIYTGWQIIDKVPFEARLERRGLDFGYSVDPTVIENIYSFNGGYIIDEITYQKELSNKSISDILLSDNKQVITYADSAEPKSIDEIKTYGALIMGADKGQGSVLQGIQYVQTLPISITKNSIKSIKAYRNYMWAKDNDGRYLQVPDDTIHEWSNPMDAIRYGFNGRIINEEIDADLPAEDNIQGAYY